MKHLRNVEVTEITCAVRSDSPECRFCLARTPDPPFLERLRDFFLLRFRSQKSILAHLEESYIRLQQQYAETKKLNEKLRVAQEDKEILSRELRELTSIWSAR